MSGTHDAHRDRGISRRQFLRQSLLTAAGVSLGASTAFGGDRSNTLTKPLSRPNVLFVAFDDMNCWPACFGQYRGTIHTPNIDALARSGTLFANAHCAVPLCNGARVSTLTGLAPDYTRVFYNQTRWRDEVRLRDVITLPQLLRQHGYHASGCGKIFHWHDSASWDSYWPDNDKGFLPEPVEPDSEHPRKGGPSQYRLDATFDWGPIDIPKEKMPDWQVADHVIAQLQQPLRDAAPFFLGCGFGHPHLPWFLPQSYFDRYPLDAVQLPEVLQNDLDDIPPAGRALVSEYLHSDVIKYGFWKKAVQAYLAAITFADEQLGRVLQALQQSPHADNTLVVLWSDHGWHLGEKLQWRKLTLWEEATHIPLIVSGPGVVANAKVTAAVSALDLYPTLAGLCGVASSALPANLAGHNFTALLQRADSAWDYPAITAWQDSHSVRSRDFRYIRYGDGSEEFYDHRNDPHEWHNLAGQAATRAEQARMAGQLQDWLSRHQRT